ncbi:hypothetical protein D3C75_862130 [compost metagenome]
MRLGQVIQALGFGLKPLIYFFLRGDVLVNVAGLVAQIEHDAILNRFIKLVGVDVAAKHLDALLLVRLKQRRAGETNKQRIGQNCLHRFVQFARLGAVALIDEHINIALSSEISRQVLT